MPRRFKLEWIDLPGTEPFWFNTREELEEHVRFLKSVPLDDGPIRLRITEYGVTRVEEV
jgi:hypothetical protein